MANAISYNTLPTCCNPLAPALLEAERAIASPGNEAFAAVNASKRDEAAVRLSGDETSVRWSKRKHF